MIKLWQNIPQNIMAEELPEPLTYNLFAVYDANPGEVCAYCTEPAEYAPQWLYLNGNPHMPIPDIASACKEHYYQIKENAALWKGITPDEYKAKNFFFAN